MSCEYDWTVDGGNRVERRRVLDSLIEGIEIEAVVSDLVDFGAFVDLGAINGLIHISELSDAPVDHPDEVVEKGEKVRVKVLEVDKERERVCLRLEQASEELSR